MDRRQLLARLPLFGAAVALPVPAFAATGSERIGMPLAADLAHQMVDAMAHPSIMGRWEITIRSGDPDQFVGFRQIDPACRLPDLIAGHRKACRDLSKAHDVVARIEDAHPDAVRTARVHVGKVLRPDGDVPKFAYSPQEIEKDRAGWEKAMTGFGKGWEKRVERTNARFAAALVEWRRRNRCRQRLARATGYNTAVAATRMAYLAERKARLRLLAYRPVTEAEAEIKARHVNRWAKRDDWSTDEVFVEALIAKLGEAGR